MLSTGKESMNNAHVSDKEMYRLFEELFQQFFEPLVSYAYHYVNDWQVAEDIVQDSFLSLWINKEMVNINDPLKPYLYRSVYNKSINYLQKASVQRQVDPEDTDALINQIILDFNQYDTLLAKDIAHEIDAYIETLPPQCKNVFRLSRKDQLRNKEIATQLNISEKAVEKHISRALTGIRQHLIKLDLLPVFLISCFLRGL